MQLQVQPSQRLRAIRDIRNCDSAAFLREKHRQKPESNSRTARASQHLRLLDIAALKMLISTGNSKSQPRIFQTDVWRVLRSQRAFPYMENQHHPDGVTSFGLLLLKNARWYSACSMIWHRSSEGIGAFQDARRPFMTRRRLRVLHDRTSEGPARPVVASIRL